MEKKNETVVTYYPALTFNASDKQLSPVLIKNQPYFVAVEVCDILDLKNPSDRLKTLDDDEKLTYVLNRAGQKRAVNLINESGLYNLIFQSRKPEAKAFRKWVTSEVLPAIRRTGSYNPAKMPAIRERSRREGFNIETLRMLWLIDSNLNHGDQTQIALELGVSLTAVNQVLRGSLRSSRILWACYQRAIDNSKSSNDLYSNPKQAIEIFNKTKTIGGQA